MSYARHSEHSDVYLYSHAIPGLTCCGCFLNQQSGSPTFDTLEAALAHLDEHQAAGDKCGHNAESAYDWASVKAEIADEWDQP